MRCARIEKLLPLYVGGDLGEKECARVRSHLHGCDSCRQSAEAFRGSQERLHAFAPPEFDDDFYEGLRAAVLSEISSRPVARPTVFRALQAFFPMRRAAAASLVLLLILVALAGRVLHQSLSKSGTQTIAAASGVIEIKSNEADKSPGPQSGGAALIDKVVRRNLLSAAGRRASRKAERQAFPPVNQTAGRPPQTVPKKDEVAAQGKAQASKTNGASGLAPAAEVAVARMEIQTTDPNIRIIWLGRKSGE
jgi:hypothetical protein